MMCKLQYVEVPLKERNYRIYYGYDILACCVQKLKELTKDKEVFIVSDSNVYAQYGSLLEKLLRDHGYTWDSHIIRPGEKSKSWQEAEIILNKILEKNLSRNSALLALGGGITGDLAGFVAALYKRGMTFIQVPTTLLAQVDSSVGGKVAVNHPLGKNMLGTFYQPAAVWADLSTLQTLPQAEWVAGLAEVLKYAVIKDEAFFYFLEEQADKIWSRDAEVVPHIIRRCCQIKAQVVGEDERDEGLRNILNFGHTIGHALEKATGFTEYRHGEAVAVGMVGALYLAELLGMVNRESTDRVKRLLEQWQLPTTFSSSLIEDVLTSLQYDKKSLGKQPVFILPERLGKVVIKRDISREIIKQCLIKLVK